MCKPGDGGDQAAFGAPVMPPSDINGSVIEPSNSMDDYAARLDALKNM